MSANGRGNQNHIGETIGANHYSIQKEMVRRMHVHYTDENIWGGLCKKCQCDVVNDEDRELIMKWWETSLVVSPNQKDVKRQRIVPKIL
jgi:isochorismate hydrolase